MPRIGPRPVQRIVFSSAELPAHLGDRARFSLWRDLYAERYGLLNIRRPSDRQFAVRFEFTQLAGVGFGQFSGTVDYVGRTRREVARAPSDNLCLVVNRGGTTMAFAHRGREAALPPGAAALFHDGEPGVLRGAPENAWFALIFPPRDLLTLVADAEDLTGRPLDRALPALRHLCRYLDILAGAGDDPSLTQHVAETLIDLVALALGATREGAEVARTRGLRAARLQDIRAEIKTGFADAAFTVQTLASRHGLSPRYVQDLLHEAGASFTERVLELRLQKARAMLADRRHDQLRVGDIAYECGFDSVSYFNRCFRRRFSASPTQYRGSSSAAD
jgi:AraC-like DNA-binding protein